MLMQHRLQVNPKKTKKHPIFKKEGKEKNDRMAVSSIHL